MFRAILLLALAGCATTAPGTSVDLLRARIDAGDLAGADALIAARPGGVDTRRALDLAIRGGHVDAMRHYVGRTDPDVALEPDGSTPLIRAIVDAPADTRVALVAALRQAGADPARRDPQGRDARAHASMRGSATLRALPEGPTGAPSAPPPPPAFAAWLDADTTAAPMLANSARSGPEGAAPPEPLPGAYAAWRTDAGRLRMAMIGDAFAAGCIGGAGSAAGGEPDRLVLACEPLPAPAPVTDAGWSQDFARAMLDEIDAPCAPSNAAIASGRISAEEAGRPARRVLSVSLQGTAPGATCRPGRARPRPAAPSPRVLGDWLAMHVRHFEAVSPLPGALCPQPRARDAALGACRARSARDP